MADDNILTDDYVADLLAKDAKESSIKYSAMGLDAFKDSKPPPNKPKPNTRFLRNIIKDTDSHNAALLAKEAAESRSRLEGLVSKERREEKAKSIGGSDIRKRQLGDIAAILGGRPHKRKRNNDLEDENRPQRRRDSPTTTEKEKDSEVTSSRKDREHKWKEETYGGGGRSTGHRQKVRREDVDSDGSRTHRRHRRRGDSVSPDRMRDRHHKRRHRSRSTDRREERGSYRRRRSRSRSPRDDHNASRDHYRSSRRSRSASSTEDIKRHHRSRRHSRLRSRGDRDNAKSSKINETEEAEAVSDSDPLDEIIGPRPASPPVVRSRGRGLLSSGSGIEARFSSSYDPTTDVQVNPEEEDDWDQALEALRDRQKWHQAGAARLRAAGFTDEEVAKWEKGGEKTEADVKWVKHGESREWDRGKVIDDEGAVNIDVNWGRLKGT